MTSRETAELIDKLIMARFDLRDAVANNMPLTEQALLEKIERIKRELADALKRLDHNPGVYAG